jgi:hypothetical protein
MHANILKTHNDTLFSDYISRLMYENHNTNLLFRITKDTKTIEFGYCNSVN